jgi:hypothetical protein
MAITFIFISESANKVQIHSAFVSEIITLKAAIRFHVYLKTPVNLKGEKTFDCK